MAVHETVSEFEHGDISIVLVHFPFVIGDGLSDYFLFVQVSSDGVKVAFFKVLDFVLLSEDGTKVGKEILDKDGSCFGISQVHSIRVHGGVECGTGGCVLDEAT